MVLETNASDPRDAPPGFGRHWSAVFKIPDEQLAAICISFLESVARLFSSCRCTKPGMFYEERRKSVIADSFDEFLVKGELNFISSDFIVSEHTFLIF